MPTTSTDPRAAAAALLVPGTTCHSFAVERCETVPELDSDAYVLRHTASGARLLYLACDDENKAFAIGFKTPPAGRYSAVLNTKSLYWPLINNTTIWERIL